MTALGRNELPTLIALSDLKAEANLIGGLLAEISLVPERVQLVPLRDRLSASTDRARKALTALSAQPEAKDIGVALEDLLAFARDDSIMAMRDRELAAHDEEWKLVRQSREKGEILAAQAEKLAAQSREAVSQAVGSSNSAVGIYRAVLTLLSIMSLAALLGAFVFVRKNLTRRLNSLCTAVHRLAARRSFHRRSKGGTG